MKFITDYLRLIVFCSGLLMGIQIPAVVDQYQKRVDAHLTEATDLLAGFQQTADRYFDGNMQALINHYEKSDDAIFRDDAVNIRFMSERVSALQAEMAALQRNLVLRASHVLFFANPKLLSETMQQYSYMILLDPFALIWGVVSAVSLAALLDGLIAGMGFCALRIIRRPRVENDS
ncbi:DUF2937 family protein [Paraglaciecola aquimarina]|uniref:DUF2937 family protein n=1 Tax=Paraglaciecola aquimarina TaxID=1235557 RepID=A0ABU3SS65_9ALTE|nr:DUF2937 family protein [Paraglaciecola aquimarina]MDU0352864.1 DUF2937 family protein [Paraglaciecola aquimarina]